MTSLDYNYDYADKTVKVLNKRFIEMFGKVRSLISFDEIHVIGVVKTLYEEMYALTRRAFLTIARKAYKEADGTEPDIIDELWLISFLESYDPITKYVFAHEVERKMYYLIEGILASKNKKPEIDKALRLWSSMVSQYAIETVDEAVKQAYADNNVIKVRWIAEKDEKTCAVCDERNGKVFILKDLPPKPHIGCRCRTEPVKEAKNES